MRSRFLLPLILVALIAVGCSDAANPVVATVNDTDIYLEDVEALRPIYGTDAVIDLAALIGDTTIGEQLRSDTSVLVWRQAMLDRLTTDFGVSVTDAEVASIVAQMDLMDTSGFAVPINAEAVRAFDATVEAIRRNALDNLLDTETLGPLYEREPTEFVTVCVRHVLVGTRGEAETVVSRLTDGEDFGTVATDVSTDTVPNGDLGCRSASAYVPEFAAASASAPLDTVFGPVETQFGFHVIVVYDRTAPADLADLVARAETFVPEQVQRDLFAEWFNRAIIEADVVVTPWLGTWVPEAQGISPPE